MTTVWLVIIPIIVVFGLTAFSKPSPTKKSTPNSEKSEDTDDEENSTEDKDDEDDEEEPVQNSASARKPKKITALLTFGGAILITLVFLIDLIVLGTTAHNVSGLSKGAATLKFGNAVCAP